MRPDDPAPLQRRTARPGGRGRFFLFALFAVLFVLLLSLRGISNFYTNYLWFDSLDRTSVWSTVIQAKLGLFAIFFAFFFVLLLINMTIAQRIAPAIRPRGPEEDVIEQYYELVGDKDRHVRFGAALLFSVMVSWNVPSHWNEWLLFRNRVDFGEKDPQFNTDIGYYLFELPFLSYVVNWVFSAIVAVLLLTMIVHFLNGGIRLKHPGDRATPQVKAHLSVLLALLAAVKAVDYYLQRFELTVSTRGVVDGATYTDVNAQLPAIQLLMLISGFAILLLLANIRWRGWTLPALAVGLWAFVAIVMGGIYPAVVQRFQVDPNESQREAEFTIRNIVATRAALGLDTVDRRTFSYDDEFINTVDNSVLAANADVLDDVRLIDPRIMRSTFQNLQGDRSFYQFSNLDTDRYLVDGEMTPVVIGARELDLSSENQWEREHVAFTHGYGVAIAQGDTVGQSGQPEFLARDIPLNIEDELDLEIERPQLYYSEGLSSYSVVGATRDEIDFTDDSGQERLIRYDGSGGVALDSFTRKMAFSMRFGQIDPLISEFITEESRLMFYRDVTDRAHNLAPFLEYDSDPYPVAIDGRIHYVIDGYTTSNRYPYAQRASQSGAQQNPPLANRANYIRNSVKAVVDAYDGDVQFYLTPNLDDPIIEAYMNAFPGLFQPASDMPAELAEHLRFPQELFTIQSNMWGQYQLAADKPEAFLSSSAGWVAAQDPGFRPGVGTTITTQTLTGEVQTVGRVKPYYAVQVLPGETEERFVAIRSYVPRPQGEGSTSEERRELTAMLVADSSAENYGKLIEYKMSSTNVKGPLFVASLIASNTEVSRENTLLDERGSQVLFGEFQLIPFGQSILYVRPMYVQAEGDSAAPELRQVIVSMDGEVAMGVTLGKAIDKLFGTTNGARVVEGSVIALDDPDTSPGQASEPDPDRSELLALLIELFDLEVDRSADAQERADRLREAIADQYRAEGRDVPPEFLPPSTSTTVPLAEPSPDTTVEEEPEPA